MSKKILTSLLLLTGLNAWTQNQIEQLNSFTAGDFSVAKVTFNEKRPDEKYIEATTKPWPVQFNISNNTCNEVTILRAGVVEEKFLVDVPGYPAYYSNGVSRITFLDGVLYYYSWKNSTAEIKYLLGNDPNRLTVKNLDEITTKLNAYLTKTFAGQSEARTNLVTEQNIANEREKVLYSLKDKNIKKIEFVWITAASEIGLQTKVKYGIKAVDVNGVEYKTPSLGGQTPYEDFILAVTGAQPGDDFLTVESSCDNIPGDKIQVTVKNKFNPAIQSTSSINLSYSTPVTITYRGENGCGQAMYKQSGTGGGTGKSLDIYATSKNNLILVEIKDATSGESLHKIKVKPGTPIHIDVCGGSGCSGYSSGNGNGGNGGSGGDGGSVTIHKTPGLSGCAINVQNTGGHGGSGGKGASLSQKGSDGRNGSDGYINEVTENFTLNF